MLEEALKKNHLSVQEAIRLGLELVESCGGRGNARLRCCREIIRMGASAYRQACCSKSFAEALQFMLQMKADRRARTIGEIHSITKRILKNEPSIAKAKLSSLQDYTWEETLRTIFPTLRQQNKARMILHSLFHFGERQGWCSANPMQRVYFRRHIESEIHTLSLGQIRSLLITAQQPKHRPCMAALGIMLWAGVRPAETARLEAQDINLAEKVISIRPMHSKTGGRRHIPIAPVLAAWLKAGPYNGRICPPNWHRRWKALRRDAGIHPWPQDVLRHTFASYHLKQHRNLPLLQVAMGHRSAELLQTRYLNMQGLTLQGTRQFWDSKLWRINS